MKKKSKEVEPSNNWKCMTCADQPEFEHKEAMEHFSKVHGIDTRKTRGNRSMLMHMDGDTWFSWQYEWTIGDIKAIQTTVSPRSKNDMMRHV